MGKWVKSVLTWSKEKSERRTSTSDEDRSEREGLSGGTSSTRQYGRSRGSSLVHHVRSLTSESLSRISGVFSISKQDPTPRRVTDMIPMSRHVRGLSMAPLDSDHEDDEDGELEERKSMEDKYTETESTLPRGSIIHRTIRSIRRSTMRGPGTESLMTGVSDNQVSDMIDRYPDLKDLHREVSASKEKDYEETIHGMVIDDLAAMVDDWISQHNRIMADKTMSSIVPSDPDELNIDPNVFRSTFEDVLTEISDSRSIKTEKRSKSEGQIQIEGEVIATTGGSGRLDRLYDTMHDYEQTLAYERQLEEMSKKNRRRSEFKQLVNLFVDDSYNGDSDPLSIQKLSGISGIEEKLAELKRQIQIGIQAQKEIDGRAMGGFLEYKAELEAFFGFEAEAKGEIVKKTAPGGSWGGYAANLTAEMFAGIRLSGSATGSLGTPDNGITVKVDSEARVGVAAGLRGRFDVTPGQLSVALEVEGFAGVELKTSGTCKWTFFGTEPVTVSGSGSVNIGIGGKAGFSLDAGIQKSGFSFKAAATIGLGLGTEVDFKIDHGELAVGLLNAKTAIMRAPTYRAGYRILSNAKPIVLADRLVTTLDGQISTYRENIEKYASDHYEFDMHGQLHRR